MGTEVLQPHDILSSRRLGSSPSTAAAGFLLRRRRTATSCPASNPSPRPHRRPEPRHRREGSPRPTKTILRRGEFPESKPCVGLRAKARKEAGWIGPEPAAVPRQTLPAEARAAGRVETYAGSAFSLSPSPRALPLPTFSSRRAAEGGGGAVDHDATRDLRRLLRLD